MYSDFVSLMADLFVDMWFLNYATTQIVCVCMLIADLCAAMPFLTDNCTCIMCVFMLLNDLVVAPLKYLHYIKEDVFQQYDQSNYGVYNYPQYKSLQYQLSHAFCDILYMSDSESKHIYSNYYMVVFYKVCCHYTTCLDRNTNCLGRSKDR